MNQERDPRKNPEVGDEWSEGAGINGVIHTVKDIHRDNVLMNYDGSRERWIKMNTFRHNCKWCWSYEGKETKSRE